MSKRKKSNPNSKVLTTALVFGVAVVGLLAAYVKFGGDSIPPEDRRPARTTAGTRVEDTPPATQTKTYFRFDPADNWKAVAVEVPAGQDPVQATVKSYVESAYSGSEVKLLSVDVQNKVAEVNFTKGFAGEAGSMEEGELIEGLMRVLGQFDNIDKAKLLIEGEVLETGHNVYDDVDVIRAR